MKRTVLWMLMFTLTAGVARAQDAATQQQIDKLNGDIQDLQATLAKQDKEIEDLTRQVSELSDKVSTPVANNSASEDDLKALAAQVQEIDKKRQDDRDLIVKQLAKISSGTTTTTTHRTSGEAPPTTDTPNNYTTDTGPAVPQKGYDYIVKSGDYLSTIAKAYREKGVKVTTAEILKANPGLDPTKLYVGKKIFIPDASAQ